MQDIAYFGSRIPSEPGDGPAGWTIAEVFATEMSQAGIEVGETRAFWNGVVFRCRLCRARFEVELTPYFEVEPVEWSVQFRRSGLAKYVPFLGREEEARLWEVLDGVIAGDSRLSLIKWDTLAELGKQDTAAQA